MNYDTSFIYSGLALDELSDISNFSNDLTNNFEPKIINKNQWLAFHLDNDSNFIP